MKLLVALFAFPLWAQMWPFPGPGMVPIAAGGACVSGDANYAYCSTYALPTIIGTVTNLPALVNVILGAGKINSASCFDVSFATTTANTTKLNWGGRTQLFELCDNATGHIQAWVYFTAPATGQQLVILSGGAQGTNQSPGNAFSAEVIFDWHGSDGSAVSTSDESATNKTVTLTGTPTAAAGKVGPGSTSSGTTQGNYVVFSNSYATNPTAALWWKSNGAQPTADSALLRCVNDYLSINSRIGTNNTARGSFNAGGVRNADSVVNINDGNWHHVVFTYDGSTGRLYIDGAIAGTSNTSTATIGNGGGNMNLFAGSGGTQRYSYGYEDEVQIYNVVKTADWILAAYTNQNDTANWLTKVN